MSKECIYRLLDSKDEDQVKALMYGVVFGPDGDPLYKSLKFDNPRESSCWVDFLMPHFLADGVSIVAVHQGTGKVVGVRLSTVVSADSRKILEVSKDHADTRKIWTTLKIVEHLFEAVDIFQKYNVSRYANLLHLAVDPDYRRRGIAAKLMEVALKVTKEKGLRAAVVVATSNYSRRIFDKLGFEMLKEMQYEDCLVEGKRVLGAVGDHKSQSLHVKSLCDPEASVLSNF